MNGVTKTYINSNVTLKSGSEGNIHVGHIHQHCIYILNCYFYSSEHSSSQNNGAADIAVPVVAVILVCVAIAVAIAVVVWYRKYRHTKQFDFKSMKFSDMMESEKQETENEETEESQKTVEDHYEPVEI